MGRSDGMRKGTACRPRTDEVEDNDMEIGDDPIKDVPGASGALPVEGPLRYPLTSDPIRSSARDRGRTHQGRPSALELSPQRGP